MLLSVLIGFALVAGAASTSCHSNTFTYYPASGKCLLYRNEMKSFQQAVATCAIDRSALFMPRSAEDTADLQTAIAAGGGDDIWLGMRDNNLDKQYEYIDDNSPVTGYTFWNVPTVDQTSIKECAIYGVWDGDIKWVPADCFSQAQVVCQAEPLAKTCNTKKGWVKMQTDTCFKAYRGHRRFNYNQAKSYCQKYNAILATNLVSKQHRKEIGQLMGFLGHFWIGFHDQDNNGVYTDTNGVVMSGADKAFKRRLPRPGRCISFKRRRFFSKKCNRRQRLICQKPAV